MAYIGKRPQDTFPSNNAVTASIISANAVSSSEIAGNAVGTGEIAANAVTAAKIPDNTITATHIPNGVIATIHLAADAVTGAKIADDAIDSEHFVDGSIDTAHIADLNVTTAKIANNAITAAKIPDNTISATHIPNGLIATAHIADNAVTAAKIPDNVLTATMLPDNVILATHIPNATNLTLGTVTADLTGDVTGNVSGSSGSATGNAATATALQNARTIGGTSFDGTANIAVATATEATNVTVSANNSTDETVYPVFVDGATGTQGAETDTGLSYNPSTGVLTTTSVTGNLTGNVTGNASGTAATVTGGTQASITSAANLVTVGTIGTGVWQGTAVATAYIADNAITAAKLPDNVITATHLPDNIIAATHIPNDLIDSDHYADGSIDTAHIADDQVTAAKLANTAVTAASYGSSSAIPVITVDAQGRITAASTASTSSTLTIAADSGSNDTVTVGSDTLTFEGTANEIETTVSNNKITVGLPNNVTIAGNLTVSGTQTTVSSTTINVADPLIALATTNNAADAVDIGIYGLYDTSGSQDLYTGLFRDASDSGKWKLFKDNQAEPTTTVNTSGTGYATGTLVANLEGNVTGNVTGNVSGTAGSATGNAATATALQNARTIGGTSFDGTANIAVGLAATATALATARTIGGTSFDGTGNIAVATATEATNITASANNSTDETVYPAFVDGATGTQGIETDTGLTYNPSSGILTATQFTGAVVGNVTGNASGTAATVTGGTQAAITSAANLVTVGTIGTGVWQGTAIASGYIAADAITGAKIADDAIDSEHYTDGSIDTAHIADNAVTAAKIPDNVLSATHLPDNIIAATHLPDNVITATHIPNGVIATAHLAADAVTGAKIADDAIDSEHYAAASIDNEHLADDAVGADELAANAVVTASIVAGSVTTTELADNSVTSAKIVNGTIVTADIANNAILTQHIDDNQITGDQIADDLVLSGTGAIRMPDGTTAQRPSAAAGMFRYNTTTSKFEGYTDSWGDIGGGGSNTFTRDAFTGDGSDTTFTLSQTPESENNLLVFIEGVFQDQDAYSVSGTTLTFGTAPVNGRGIIVYSVQSAVSGSNLNQTSASGDGSTTQFTMGTAPVSENNTQVFIDGVYQHKNTYSTSGTTLTFSAAPPNGTAIEIMIFTQTDVNVPTDDSVDTAHLKADAVTTAKIADNAVTAAKIPDNVLTATMLPDNVILATHIPNTTALTLGATRVNGDFTVGAASGEDKAVIAPQSAGSGVIISSLNNAGNAYEPYRVDAETFSFRPSGTEVLGLTGSDASFSAHILAKGGHEIRAYRSGDSAYGSMFMDTGENLYIRNSYATKDLVLDRDGKLGIGTNDPNAKLEVTGSSDGNLTSAIFANTVQGGTNDTVAIELQLAGSSGQVAASTIRAGKTEDWTSGTSRSGYLALEAVLDGTNTEMVRIGSTGDGTNAAVFSTNVGLRTSSPLSHLTFESDHWNTGTEDGPSIRWNNGITTADSVIQNFEDSNVAPFLIGMNSYIASGGSYATFNSSYASSFIYQGATGNILFGNASSGTPTAKIIIEAGGDVGIGNSNPHSKLNVNGIIRAENSAFLAGREDAGDPAYAFHDDSDTGMFNIASNILAFSTAGTERMRFDASGNASIGGSDSQAIFNVRSAANAFTGHFINSHASTPYGLKVEYTGGSPNSSSNYWFFYAEDTTEAKAKLRSNGYFYLAGTAYGSDRELKENIVDTPDSLTKLKQIKVRDFNLKGQSEKHTGVIAQEIETLFPDLLGEEVISKQDAEVEKKIKTVEYNGLIGILIKSVQELEARLAALE